MVSFNHKALWPSLQENHYVPSLFFFFAFMHACMLSPVSFASYLVTLVCPSVTFNFNVYTHIEEAK